MFWPSLAETFRVSASAKELSTLYELEFWRPSPFQSKERDWIDECWRQRAVTVADVLEASY